MRAPHRYLPTGDRDREEMLAAIGSASIEELFASLPAAVQLDEAPAVPGPWSDQELRRHFGGLAARNLVGGRDLASFLGAGAYRHEIPAAVDHLLQRGEFFTVYTPYQPEVSQGTLQAIFEFQTFIALLTGLDVANASLYDGATAFAEAVLMADRLKKPAALPAGARRKAVVSRAIHPHYRQTLAAYAQNLDLEVVEVGWDERGRTDVQALAGAVDAATVCVAVQSPNYFGVAEGWRDAVHVAHGAQAQAIAVVGEALSLALLESPGAAGCDIACGEAQSFGLPLAFGGPYLGFFAARDATKRQMPGRLAGQTVDVDGRPAYVLTLSTREQHIRRERATSNICTNQSLCALAATVYLALHGRQGLRRLAELNLQRAASLRGRLAAAAGLDPMFAAPHFNEFALRSRVPVEDLLASWREAGVIGGVPLGPDYPELADGFLVAVTECNPPEELDRYVDVATTAPGAHAEVHGG